MSIMDGLKRINQNEFDSLVLQLKEVAEKLSSFEFKYTDGSTSRIFPNGLALSVKDTSQDVLVTAQQLIDEYYQKTNG